MKKIICKEKKFFDDFQRKTVKKLERMIGRKFDSLEKAIFKNGFVKGLEAYQNYLKEFRYEY